MNNMAQGRTINYCCGLNLQKQMGKNTMDKNTEVNAYNMKNVNHEY
jgi:hypothetical protein